MTNSNSPETNNVSNEKHKEYEDLSAIEEHELDYKRRRKRIEFAEGSSRDELIEKANSSPPSSQEAPSASDKSKT